MSTRIDESPRMLSDADFESLVSDTALIVSRGRKLDTLYLLDQITSTQAEMDKDREVACALHLQRVIQGTIPFGALDLSYLVRLASIWLDDLKEVTAYGVWRRNCLVDGVWSTEEMKLRYYLAACREISEYLFNQNLKDSVDHFKEAEKYAKDILNDPLKKESLIDRKTRFLKKKVESAEQCEAQATEYVDTFYKNIISAIKQRKRSSIQSVISALRLGTLPQGGSIIDGFEAAVTVRFLDATSCKGESIF